MSNLNMTLSLEGREEALNLRFNKISFLKYLGKVSEGYDFIKAQILYEPGKLYQSVFYFIWAALVYEQCIQLKKLSENNSKEPDELDDMAVAKITKRIVSDVMDELDFTQMMDIQRHAWAAMSGKTVEEIIKGEEDAKNLVAQVMNNGTMEKVL